MPKKDAVETAFDSWSSLTFDQRQQFDLMVRGYMRAGSTVPLAEPARRGRPAGSRNRVKGEAAAFVDGSAGPPRLTAQEGGPHT